MANTSHVIRRWAPVLALLLTLVACGGGGDGGGAGGGPQGSSAVIGPAGGTVLGPNGAKVVIPPGAISTDTLIRIEQTSVGAPALPAGFAAFGQMFAFTPHGISFAVPATITLPFDAASAPAGSIPALYKTNAANQWERVANARRAADGVSAQVTSFSHAIEKLSAPDRSWIVSDYLRSGAPADIGRDSKGRPLYRDQGIHDQATLLPWESRELKLDYDFGPAFLLDPSAPIPETLPREFRASGHIFASAGGGTYGISGEAPISNDVEKPAGNRVSFTQSQTFIKTAANATLRLKVTQVRLEAVDYGKTDLDQCRNTVRALCDGGMTSNITFTVEAFPESGERNPNSFFSGWGGARLNGWRKHWTLSALDAAYPGHEEKPNRQSNLWNNTNFTRDADVEQDGSESHAKLELTQALPIDVDLSSVGVDEVFTLEVTAETFVLNKRISEGSYLGAFFRDPVQIGGDAEVITEGLVPIDTPLVEPPADPNLPPGCAPGASPGTLQFFSPDDSVAEAVGASGATLFVARTRGSTGEVTAIVSTSDGTATSGSDYAPVNTTISFPDGDTVPRPVNVPLVYSEAAEPDKTFNVILSAPTGCASLGMSASVVTILDDTRALPTSFTIGGTVTGLVGSGLVLSTEGLEQAIGGNGAFTFTHPLQDGWLYDVRVKTQPANPSQVCSVTRGKGTISGANVIDMAVDCTTPAANGALDTAFGESGKVTTGLTGGATSMVLQNDGKLLLLGKRTLARYNTNGSVDTSFGSGGQVAVVFNGGMQDAAQGLALQADGKIVVVGYTRVGTSDDFAVARYDTNGALDAGFGTGGKVSVDFNGLNDRAWAPLIQPNGSIVVAGHAAISIPAGGDNDFAVARFSSSGILDLSFGTGGKVTTNVKDRTDLAFAAALQQDGKIVLTGGVGLVRYTAAGSLDPTFGAGGIARLDSIGNTIVVANDLALQSDGKIVVIGHAGVGTDIGFALARFTASGAPDNAFGSGGVVTTTFTTQDDYGRGVALQGDGKIVVIGQSSNLAKPDFAVARFTSAGTPDASFGTAGKLTIDFFGSGDDAQDLAIQADGKIVVSGVAANGTSLGVGLARINP